MNVEIIVLIVLVITLAIYRQTNWLCHWLYSTWEYKRVFDDSESEFIHLALSLAQFELVTATGDIGTATELANQAMARFGVELLKLGTATNRTQETFEQI